jgi:hypothetical protein
MADLSDLPMLHDIDADYSTQYVALARILRDKFVAGEYRRGDILPAAELAGQCTVAVTVLRSRLARVQPGSRAGSPWREGRGSPVRFVLIGPRDRSDLRRRR